MNTGNICTLPDKEQTFLFFRYRNYSGLLDFLSLGQVPELLILFLSKVLDAGFNRSTLYFINASQHR